MAQGFLTDNNNDLAIENGVFAIGEDDNQNMAIICGAELGDIKMKPLVGAGFKRLQNAQITTIQKAAIDAKRMIENDGFVNVTTEYDGENINVNGEQ